MHDLTPIAPLHAPPKPHRTHTVVRRFLVDPPQQMIAVTIAEDVQVREAEGARAPVDL